MTDQTPNAWRCSVCGYVHQGASPPDVCPICGASRDDFEPYVDETRPSARDGAERWKCLNCGHVHVGSQPPERCPVCGARTDRFEPVDVPAEQAASTSQPKQVVIVGAGIAGISAAESLRAASPSTEIVLISREKGLPYYRLNLTRYLAGEVAEQELPLRPEGWYEEQNIALKDGAEVADLALDEHVVRLRDGESVPFEKLILTAGSHPFVPPFPGATRGGVTSLRTLDDARQILQSIPAGPRCVCIGGGILGLEAVGGLARRGANVTLLEGHGWLLPRQLNETAASIVEQHVAKLGINLLKGASVAEILGDERVRGVQLKDGATVPADLVIIATGVRPNSYLARQAGLEVNQGVVVDNHLVTSHSDVLAAGDVAEHRGVVYGLWNPSQYQGSIAGMNAAGRTNEFGGIPRSNTLKVLGLDLFSIGQFEPTDASFEVCDERLEDRYWRFCFRDNALVGAILLGDTTLTAPTKAAVERRADFSALLRKRPSAADVKAHLTERA